MTTNRNVQKESPSLRKRTSHERSCTSALPLDMISVVALTQISAYIAHKNLAVRKIMEAMRMVYAKKMGLSLNTPQTKHDANDHGTYVSVAKESAHRLRSHSILLNRLMNLVVKELLKCGIRLSISFRWYAFPNFCRANSPTWKQCTHLLKSWRDRWMYSPVIKLVIIEADHSRHSRRAMLPGNGRVSRPQFAPDQLVPRRRQASSSQAIPLVGQSL